MSTFIDIHIIQTLPSSNVNRDDTGRPKTCVFGGFTRARVSSQAWKRATRRDFARNLPAAERAVRTRRIIADLVDRIGTIEPDLPQEEAIGLATSVMKAAGIDFKAARPRKPKKGEEPEPVDPFELSEYLLFVSNQQVDRLARLALESRGASVDKKAAKSAIDEAHGVEVALFGRMVADDTSLNVDAAVQVAHAVGTHAVEPEYDYFTAVDDNNPESESGAGMIGVVEFNSSTLYRYATINLDQLRENLGDDEQSARAVAAFAESFVVSMPTGKQNAFANGTLPEAVVAQVREGRSLNLSGAFERPVEADGRQAISTASAVRLAGRLDEVQQAYGQPAGPTLVLAANAEVRAALQETGEPATLPDLVARLRSYVGTAVAESS